VATEGYKVQVVLVGSVILMGSVVLVVVRVGNAEFLWDVDGRALSGTVRSIVKVKKVWELLSHDCLLLGNHLKSGVVVVSSSGDGLVSRKLSFLERGGKVDCGGE
jgi:hypothetical protein